MRRFDFLRPDICYTDYSHTIIHQALKFDILKKTQAVNSKLKEKTQYLEVKTQALDSFIIDSYFFLQINWIFLMILQFSTISTEAIKLFH